jgi:hypothetical protein
MMSRKLKIKRGKEQRRMLRSGKKREKKAFFFILRFQEKSSFQRTVLKPTQVNWYKCTKVIG